MPDLLRLLTAFLRATCVVDRRIILALTTFELLVDDLLKQRIGSHLGVVLQNIEQAGQAHEIPVYVLQDVGQLILDAGTLTPQLVLAELPLHPQADSVNGLVLLSYS